MQTYTVQLGDTLQAIGNRYHTTVQQLMVLNRITCPLCIFPGQVILLPAPNKPLPGGCYYTAEPGDTVHLIAQSYNVPIMDIIRANTLVYPYIIHPDQLVFIPKRTPTPPPVGTAYIVKPGDTLFIIAKRFNTTVESIAAINSISDPHLIYPGKQLIIPPPGVRAYIIQPGDYLIEIAEIFNTTVEAIVNFNNIQDPNHIYPSRPLLIPPPNAKVYLVQLGDTLSTVARKFKTTVDSIIIANRLTDPNKIFPRQRLIVPGPVPKPSPLLPTTLRRGDRGPDVLLLQTKLLDAWFDPGPIDGIFGPRTEEAVNNLQKAKSLPVTGIVDETTWKKLLDSSPNQEFTTYTVKAGDTLFLIAEQFGTTVESIVIANNIEDDHIMFPEQTLVIPPSSGRPEEQSSVTSESSHQ